MTITAPLLFSDLDLSDPDEQVKVTNTGKTIITWLGIRRKYALAPRKATFVPLHIVIRYMGDPRSEYKKVVSYVTPSGDRGVIPERRGELIRLSVLYGLYHGKIRDLPKMAPKVTVTTLNDIAIEFPINNPEGISYPYQTDEATNIDVRTELDKLKAQMRALSERGIAIEEHLDEDGDEAGDDTAPGM